MSKWLKAVFVISLALNVLFVGLTIGHFSKRAKHWGKMRADVTQTLSSLPEEKREMVLSAMKELRKETRGTKREVRQIRRQMIDTLTAENFDAEKFESEAQDLHDLLGIMTMEMAMTVSELAENLNQEEREALSNFVEQMRKHRRRGGPPGMRPPHPPPPEHMRPHSPPEERY